ncbi:MAG: DUF362 domain-containing protein [Bryobacterales bacterium]|nr:DUF362 domain-containing protein [Bryobacterales bacterium]
MQTTTGNFSRRDWLAVSGLAAGVLAAGRAQAAAAAPVAPVAVAKVPSYDEDLVARFETMFDQIGGLGGLVRDKTVAMKLNLTGGGRYEGYTAGQTHWVHPRVVGALTAVFGKLGARRVRILESAGRREGIPLEDKLLSGGWDVNAIRNAAPVVEFEDTNGLGLSKSYSTLQVRTAPMIFSAFTLNRSYEDCDFFVSVGKMKNHEEMGITMSMKNLFGITPALLYGSRETVFHYGRVQPPSGVPAELDPKSNRYEGWRLPRLITDICGARPIDLAVLDGIESCVGGEGPWCLGSKPCKPQLLLVGRNCVCTDAVGVATMGYNPRAGRNEAPFRVYKDPKGHPPEQLIPPGETHQYAENIMLLAESVGMGSADLSRIEVRGVPVKEAMFDFEAFWKGQMRA